METPENKTKTKSSSSEMDWPKIKQERIEYFQQLTQWLEEARLWYSLSAGFSNNFSGLPFPDVGGASAREQNAINPYAAFYQVPAFGFNRGLNDGARLNDNQQVPNGNVNNAATFNGVPFYQTYPFILPPNLLRLPTTYQFKIPPLWKRLCAELIDFCILFIVKLALTFLFMESFSIGNAFDLYGLDILQKGFLEGQELNFPLAFELVLLEFLHRFIVCAFETYFLRGKMCATPGKRCLGLMVVNVETLTLVPNGQNIETVTATGVKTAGWQRALLRSILKNLMVGLLLPLCVTFYIFPYNRTSYDMMANTLVVEAHPEFLLYQSLIVL
ncbi:unnamed protein product [Ceutorhynchus assimilis]|uniref:RDD domain-containing protein n=1 Tax=Ceutorhynchus assimilis TaxID=467358 RepID=A0A9N9MBS5_9CUCU|nr:unnamed protein product [Ceutorhynchus assimilis]